MLSAAVQAELELLGIEFDEETTAELELSTTEELLGIELEEETTVELELSSMEELLGIELEEDEGNESSLEEDGSFLFFITPPSQI